LLMAAPSAELSGVALWMISMIQEWVPLQQ
jgi:hypothetical protein